MFRALSVLGFVHTPYFNVIMHPHFSVVLSYTEIYSEIKSIPCSIRVYKGHLGDK